MTPILPPAIGFVVCQLAALAMTGATVIGFFAGGLQLGEWNAVQAFYGVVGLAVAVGLTAFTGQAYRSRLPLPMIAAALIGVSLEVAQTLERSTALRQDRSRQSVAFKTAAAALPVAAASLPSSEALAAARARLKAIPPRPDRKTARIEAQAEVNRLTEKRRLEQEDATGAETRAFARLQTLEHDDHHAHAAVRLLMDMTGVGFSTASGLFGLGIVLALHVAMYFLGGADLSQPDKEASATPVARLRDALAKLREKLLGRRNCRTEKSAGSAMSQAVAAEPGSGCDTVSATTVASNGESGSVATESAAETVNYILSQPLEKPVADTVATMGKAPDASATTGEKLVVSQTAPAPIVAANPPLSQPAERVAETESTPTAALADALAEWLGKQEGAKASLRDIQRLGPPSLRPPGFRNKAIIALTSAGRAVMEGTAVRLQPSRGQP
jgi:hypothetical protein